MASWQSCWEKVQQFAPDVARSFCEQSAQVQQQIIEMIADHARFVRRDEFEQQKALYQRLEERLAELEKQIQELE